MKRTVLKVLLVLVVLSLIGGIGILISMVMNNGDPNENREVVSTWYSVKPYDNTITLYDNGTYTSLALGTPDGTYEMSGDTCTMTDEAGMVRVGTIEGHMMTFKVDNIVHEYYDSQDLIPEVEKEDQNIDYGVLSLRLTMAQKLLDQGEWTGEGHTLDGTMTTITLDGKEMPFTVDDVEIYDDETLLYTLTVDGEEKQMFMSVDQATLVYTIILDGMTFTTPGDNLRLDS